MQKPVVVIGAGTAGLGAAQQLFQFGIEVIVLEARKRPCGRISYIDSKLYPGEKVDTGASIITGLEGNPLEDLVIQLGLDPIPVDTSNGQLFYKSNGTQVPQVVDVRCQQIFDEALQGTTTLRSKSVYDKPLGQALRAFFEASTLTYEPKVLDWYCANLEYSCATDMDSLSYLHWDHSSDHDFQGQHVTFAGGLTSLIQPLEEDINVHYSMEVVKIVVESNKLVRVYTKDGKFFDAAAALVTVPLGVLKRQTISFVPNLPESKKAAIQRLGYGSLNKIVIRFPDRFWGTKSWLGIVNDVGTEVQPSNGASKGDAPNAIRGRSYIFWSVEASSPDSKPVIVAICSGQGAKEAEDMKDEDLINDACTTLQKIYNLPVRPLPIESVVTRWGHDPYSLGAFSYVSVGSRPEDYEELAKPVLDRVFFAGEATNRQHPSTVGGAYQSGLTAARDIYRAFQGHEPRTRDMDITLNRDSSINRHAILQTVTWDNKVTSSKPSLSESYKQDLTQVKRVSKPTTAATFAQHAAPAKSASSSTPPTTPAKARLASSSASSVFSPTADSTSKKAFSRKAAKVPAKFSASIARQSSYSTSNSTSVPYQLLDSTPPSPPPLVYTPDPASPVVYLNTPSPSKPSRPLFKSPTHIKNPTQDVAALHHQLVRQVLTEAVKYFGKGDFIQRDDLKLLSQHCACDLLDSGTNLDHSDIVQKRIVEVVKSQVSLHYPSAIER
jgi:monoamine oxidase